MDQLRLSRHLAAILFVTIVFLTGAGRDLARAEPILAASDRPTIVAISPLGTINRRQIFNVLINQLTGEAIAFGYLNYIHGLDEKDLYSEASNQPESKALFTLFIKARVTRVHAIGPMVAYELLGTSTIFFDDTPDGDYAKPETFRDGIPIATGEENVVYTFDSTSGSGTGDVRLRQTNAWPNDFRGRKIQFGEVGNHAVAWRGKTIWNNWLGWTRVYCTATTVQAAPVQADLPR